MVLMATTCGPVLTWPPGTNFLGIMLLFMVFHGLGPWVRPNPPHNALLLPCSCIDHCPSEKSSWCKRMMMRQKAANTTYQGTVG